MNRRLAAGLTGALLAATVIGSPAFAQDAPTASPGSAPAAPASPAELEAAFPARLAGQPLQPFSFTGEEIIAGADPDDPVNELVDLAAAHGATISDFSIAGASVRDAETFIGVLAARISGVPAAARRRGR